MTWFVGYLNTCDADVKLKAELHELNLQGLNYKQDAAAQAACLRTIQQVHGGTSSPSFRTNVSAFFHSPTAVPFVAGQPWALRFLVNGITPPQQEPMHQEWGKLQPQSRAHLTEVGTVRYSSNVVNAGPLARAEAEIDNTASITHSELHDTPGDHLSPEVQPLAYVFCQSAVLALNEV